jgi:hydrogenase maturation protease
MNAAFSNTPAPVSAKLVIGIGNEFRNDDGVGLFMARRLRGMPGLGVKVVESSGEGMELLNVWQGMELVILVDAVHSGGAPGEIFRFALPGDTIPRAMFPRHSTHAFGLLDAVELAGTIGALPRRVIVYGIEGASFANGTEISPEVLAASAKVIENIVRDLTAGQTPSSKGGQMDQDAKIEELIFKIEQHVEENEAIKAVEVRLKIGALVDIDVDEFRDDFAHALFGTVADGARIDIDLAKDPNDPDAEEIILTHVEVV